MLNTRHKLHLKIDKSLVKHIYYKTYLKIESIYITFITCYYIIKAFCITFVIIIL